METCSLGGNLSPATFHYPITWLPDYLITWLPDYLITWLPDYLITWLPDYLITWTLHDYGR